MSLITKNDLIKAAGLKRLGPVKELAARSLMKVTKIDEVNELYDKLKDKEGADFFESFVRERDLKYVVFEEDIAKIPKTGPFILVSNHPLGAIDGILMAKVISAVRPDFKLMGNFLLDKIKPLEPYVIAVNPFESRKELYSSSSGMRETLQHLENGGCLGIFPAGEVSNRNNPTREIRDRKWATPALKLIRKARVPVVPMYFHAKNSAFFYQAARLHPDLQTLLLPSEMMRNRESPIRIRIGRPVSIRQMDEEETIAELGDYLQDKIYILRAYYERRKSLMEKMNLPDLKLSFPIGKAGNLVANIIDETPAEDIEKEIQALKAQDKMLFQSGQYQVYFATYEEIPSVMREIGRQREITFRDVGEGSNLPFDLDEYDKHYNHLFLWDEKENKIAGAYRMALGKIVMRKYGVSGFYTSSLFDFDQELHPFFRKVIEMGRAYIAKEYQQKPMPLFILWKGIIHVCLRNPDHKFLMGGVSISNKFSDFSKSLMIDFMRSNYYDSAVAQYVHPKHEFKIKIRERDKNLFVEEVESDLNKLDKLIDDLEPGMRMPVLIKKYIKQNAKVIAFNVDPSFNDAIDGLMYIRISEIPESTINPVLEEIAEQMRMENEKNASENQ
ncbi:lysophospholipid acyltransferase family protein [Chryseobacterium sp. A321]